MEEKEAQRREGIVDCLGVVRLVEKGRRNFGRRRRVQWRRRRSHSCREGGGVVPTNQNQDLPLMFH